MRFLEKDDFKVAIDLEILDSITGYPDVEDPENPDEDEQKMIDDANEKIDLAENAAISEAESLLSAKYVTDEIFNKTGDERHPMIVLRVVDFALYHLHSSLNPKEIPEIRIIRYENAMSWFDKVNEGMINPVGLPKPEDGSKRMILSGSNTKRNHYF